MIYSAERVEYSVHALPRVDRDFHIFIFINNLRISLEIVNHQMHFLVPAFEDFMPDEIETAVLLNLILFDPGKER
jgi:hypothetical protein